MSHPLAIIYNTSLRTGRVPQAWKDGVVTAIFKNKGKRSSAANYRAITLTSIVCKILEKIIVELIEAHLKENHDNDKFDNDNDKFIWKKYIKT